MPQGLLPNKSTTRYALSESHIISSAESWQSHPLGYLFLLSAYQYGLIDFCPPMSQMRKLKPSLVSDLMLNP